MNKAKCPSCKKIIEIQVKSKVRDLITCPHCKSYLELVNKYPLTLDWADDPVVCSTHRVFSKLK
jgi:hypothetical protein